MACPFFMPVAPLDHGDWIHPPRLPLGNPYRGVCHALANELHDPSEADQRELCNCGYARGRCSRLPSDSSDAVRFSVTDDDGGRIRMIWVIEKDNSPVEFGTLEFADGKVSPASPLLSAQANAFLRSYLIAKQQGVEQALALGQG